MSITTSSSSSSSWVVIELLLLAAWLMASQLYWSSIEQMRELWELMRQTVTYKKMTILFFLFLFKWECASKVPDIDKLHIFNTDAVLLLDENYLQVHQPHCYSSCHSNGGLGSLGIWISWGTVFSLLILSIFIFLIPCLWFAFLRFFFLSISYNLIDSTDDWLYITEISPVFPVSIRLGSVLKLAFQLYYSYWSFPR